MKKLELDTAIKLAENAMLKRKKELFYEWDFEKNTSFDIYEVTYGNGNIVWWNCPKCGSSYDMAISNRTIKEQKCPYCSKQRVNHTNCLSTTHPHIAKFWHPALNGDLTPHDVLQGSKKVVIWFGSCGHHFPDKVINRVKRKSDCPYCAKTNARLLKGFNDMWSTNPELAAKLTNPEDGYKYMQWSKEKVEWRCPDCGTSMGIKSINTMNSYPSACPACHDTIPIGEKFIYFALLHSNIKFIYDQSNSWSQKRRYDFYLPDYNWIIEVHGGQHSKEAFHHYKGGRTLEEEIANDQLKEDLAFQNGIKKYIVIDSKKTTMKYLYDQLKKSELYALTGELNIKKIGVLCASSFVRTVSDMWNERTKNIVEIADFLKLHQGTVRDYLKLATEIGWCNYSSIRSKRVVRLSLDGELIDRWESGREASEQLNISREVIRKVCVKQGKTAGGYKWLYEEDYEEIKSS